MVVAAQALASYNFLSIWLHTNLSTRNLMPVQMNFMWQCALRLFYLDTQLT